LGLVLLPGQLAAPTLQELWWTRNFLSIPYVKSCHQMARQSTTWLKVRLRQKNLWFCEHQYFLVAF
jgi:hypothetical protein